MKLRRLATTVAATSALVLAGAAPALADHVDLPDPLHVTNDDTGDLQRGGGNIECDDPDLALVALAPGKVDPPTDVNNEFMEATVHGDDNELLDVVAKEGTVITAVIVKGGDASFVYFHEPFTNLTAPEVPGGDPAISHYIVCGGDEDVPDEDVPDEEEPDEQEPDEEEPEETTPAAVPTEIPAGTGTAGAGTAGTVGLVAVLAAFAAGVAVIVRRRFLTES